MKHIVWTRIDDRLIHGQVMTQWIQYTEANEVLIIDDGVAKDSFADGYEIQCSRQNQFKGVKCQGCNRILE